jgi:hypothetical protein
MLYRGVGKSHRFKVDIEFEGKVWDLYPDATIFTDAISSFDENSGTKTLAFLTDKGHWFSRRIALGLH